MIQTEPKPPIGQLLLKKWNATSALQFKVFELERKLEAKEAKLANLSGLKAGK